MELRLYALPSIILIRPHCIRPLFMPRRIGAVGLGRVAVDQGAHEHRVGGAAHLVLDGEQMPAISRIDDVAEPVLVLIVLARDHVIYRRPLAVHLITLELLLIWFPFGKLMHAFLFAFSRGATGMRFSHRGVEV